MEWQKKIFDHEENPPGETWNKISAKLDEEPWMVRKTLANFEVAPPSPVWEELSTRLEEENFNSGKSFSKLIRLRPVRIAVAAAVAGIIILATYYFVSNPQLIKPSDIAANMIDSQKSSNAKVETTTRDIAKSGSEGKNTEGTTRTDEADKQADRPEEQIASLAKTVKIEQRKYSPVRMSKLDTRIRPDELSRKTQMSNVAQNFSPGYVTVTDENGVTYRISSKVRDIIHYMQGADNQFPNQNDQYVSENNYWQSVFREWKKKLNSASFIPDSGNFLDIMEFVHLMQQNK